MKYINEIPISELRLIVHSVVFTILFIGLMIAVGFWVYVSMSMKNPKEKERLRKLKEKAQSDELAKKQLEKIERRNKRRRKREKEKHYHRRYYLEYLCLFGNRYLGLGHHSGVDGLCKKKIMLFMRGKLQFTNNYGDHA